MDMTRREAVIKMAVLIGASAVASRLLAKTFGLATPLNFKLEEIALLDEIAETIIPATDIPGAKAANTGAFIAMMVADCYPASTQSTFRIGLTQIATDYETRYREKFIGGKAENRTQFLNVLDAELRKYPAEPRRLEAAGVESPPEHYFKILRELTLLGYFTSELGATQALNYIEVPGRYDGNVPYTRGDKWFI